MCTLCVCILYACTLPLVGIIYTLCTCAVCTENYKAGRTGVSSRGRTVRTQVRRSPGSKGEGQTEGPHGQMRGRPSVEGCVCALLEVAFVFTIEPLLPS